MNGERKMRGVASLAKEIEGLEKKQFALKNNLYQIVLESLQAVPALPGVESLGDNSYSVKFSTISASSRLSLEPSYYNNNIQVNAIVEAMKRRDMGIREINKFVATLLKEKRLRKGKEVVWLNEHILAKLGELQHLLDGTAA